MIGTGGTSVSGYMRSRPGSGREYRVRPSGSGSRVSPGIPSSAAAARAATRRRAATARSRERSTTKTKPSFSCRPRVARTRATSSASRPCPGSSSEWSKPPSPVERAWSANSRPSRSSDPGLERSRFANPGRERASTTFPLRVAPDVGPKRTVSKSSVTSRGGARAGDASLSEEKLPDRQQRLLTAHLAVGVLFDLAQVLDSFDLDPRASLNRDVEVFPNRPDPAADPAGGPEESSDLLGDLPGLLAPGDIGAGGDLDQGNAEPVESVDDARPSSSAIFRAASSSRQMVSIAWRRPVTPGDRPSRSGPFAGIRTCWNRPRPSCA